MNGSILKKREIINTINRIKYLEINKGFNPFEVYQHGDCSNLFFILKGKFPEAIPYVYMEKHIITYINGEFYDIKGKFTHTDTENIRKANLLDLWEFSYNYSQNQINLCDNTNQKFKYKRRTPEPKKVPLKMYLTILRDDFKHGMKVMKNMWQKLKNDS